MYKVLVLLTVFLVLCFQSNALWGSRFRFPPIPIKARTTKAPVPAPVPFVVANNPSGVPLCANEIDVNKILQEGANSNGKRRVKRAVSWPYDCNVASILKYQGSYQFLIPLYTCCRKCEYPGFTDCVSINPSPYWMCPSSGIKCIVDCVITHNPNKQVGILPSVIGRPGIKLVIPGKGKPFKPVKPAKLQCTKIVTENGKKCIKQTCVSLRAV